MKKLILFLATFLFAVDLKVVGDINVKTKNSQYVNSINEVNFSKDIAIIDVDYLPYVIEHNLYIIAAIGKRDIYIYTKKFLKDIKTIANVNLETKIFLSTIPAKAKFVKATYDELLNNNIDAYVSNKYIPPINKDVRIINLKQFGIEFNKYLIVTSQEFYKKNDEVAHQIVNNICANNNCENFIVLKEIFLTSLYLHKKIAYKKYIPEEIVPAKTLKVIVTPNWPPFDIYDGKLRGIGIDFWKLIAKKASLNYEFMLQPKWYKLLNDIKEGYADLTPNTSYTKDRAKFAIFTKPYIEFPLLVVCNQNFDGGLKDIKSLAVGKNFTAYKMMKKYFPNLNYKFSTNTYEALKWVEDGNAECAVDILPTIVYLIKKNHFNDLRVIYRSDFKFKVQIMLRKGLENIRDRLNIAISQITPEEKEEIIDKYLGEIEFKKSSRSVVFYIVIGILVVIILIVIIRAFRYKQKSEIDALTQIYNRGTIEKKIKEIIKNSDGAIIFFDIDHFKRINDTYGHDKGDEVLKTISKIVSQNIRENDYFGRWGGEEFIIVLPKASYEIALVKAEKLRKVIENYDFNGLKITSSFGVTHFYENENIDDVIKRVDLALYEAKENGRNQVKGEL